MLIAAALAVMMFAACGSTEEEDVDSVIGSYSNLDPELLSDYDYSKFKGQNITINVANLRGEYSVYSRAGNA